MREALILARDALMTIRHVKDLCAGSLSKSGRALKVIDAALAEPPSRAAMSQADLDALHQRLGGVPEKPTINPAKVK